MLNKAPLVCFDLETTGRDRNHAVNPREAWPASIAAKVYNPRTLAPFDDGEFYSLIQVEQADEVSQESLDFIKISRDELKNAPHASVVWSQFCDFVNGFKPDKSARNTPIACGQNSRAFDMTIVARMNELYCKGKGPTYPFSDFRHVDLMDITWMWFEGTEYPKRQNLQSILEFCGVEHNSGELHNALVDVRMTGELITRFLKLHRKLASKVTWKATEVSAS